jgi:hypothetical protein
MVRTEEFTYPSADGIHRVHTVLWLPDGAPEPWCSWSTAYPSISCVMTASPFLAEEGFAVVGNDHLGTG